MTDQLTIALAQTNLTVGDIAGNVAKIIDFAEKSSDRGADLLLFPEMAVTGYPPEDLVYKSAFQNAAMAAVEEIAANTANLGCALLIGGLWMEDDKRYNAAFLIERGKVIHRQYKRTLPNYGVFDEKRLFDTGELPQPVMWRDVPLGIMICEDVWDSAIPAHLSALGAQLLIVQNASPYEMGKAGGRRQVCAEAAGRAHLPLLYVNLVGGQDELVFDGRSFALNAAGEDVTRLAAFEEELAITKWEKRPVIPAKAGILSSSEKDAEEDPRLRGDDIYRQWYCTDAPMAELKGDRETVYAAMVLGLRDYVEKNGFPGVVIGLSGGIDSGLSAAVAVDALGAEKVHGVLMPSPYSSAHSIEDARELAENLGMTYDTVAIEAGMQVFDAMLGEVFADRKPDETEENIQARLRGMILMAYSNKFGHMVLTTGNKSEMSVGYATLYGDMCGGYSVLKDVYKTTVYKLARWRNSVKRQEARGEGRDGIAFTLVPHPTPLIPLHMITKPPSAELRPDQFDEDSLPPYETLDVILQGLLEQRQSMSDLVAEGHDRETVARIAKMLYTAEYKRRQSPPGVKVSGMSFGRDRRYPITNKWIWQSKL